MKKIFTTLLLTFMVVFAFSQGSLTGKVVDTESGEALMGATVMNKTTNTGMVTELDGSFKLSDLAAGQYAIEISFIGYTAMTLEATIEAGDVDMGTINMEASEIGLAQVNVVAQVAIDRKTPVAVSTISMETIETKLGNQEFTEIMKFSPSITATKNSSSGGNSGGYGDGSIVVRGFAQEDVALLINGIPVNGMEDNKIYWSNWSGLGDVTRTIQIQRGLGATALSVASIGGTINIVTKSTDQERGGTISTMIGNDGFRKFGMSISTGKTDSGWAFTFAGSRSEANGYIEYGYLDAWNYFGSIAKEINANNLITFTIFGSPQKHGQRSFAPNIATQRDVFGTKWNDDAGPYRSQNYGFRDNFYHKPQMALNYYLTMNEKTTWTNSVYASFGRGGGTGDLGGFVREDGAYRGNEFRQPKDPYGHQQFDEYNNYNRGEDNILYDTSMAALTYEFADGDGGTGQVAANGVNGLIKRASMNEHQWFGWLSKVNVDLTPNLNLSGGIDLRWYTGSHYRKSIDLLGADLWFDDDNINNKNDWLDINGDGNKDDNEMGVLVRPTNNAAQKLFGSIPDEEKIDYHNDENINWYGAFGQIEWSTGDISVFGSASFNFTQMRRIDFFQKGPSENTTDWTSFPGGTVKAGANWNINEKHNIFANLGFISRAPYFDALYPTFSNDERNDQAVNEKILAGELGYGFRSRGFRLNVNAYYTQWQDKTTNTDFTATNGETYFLNLLGVDALHVGIEADLTASLTRNLNLTGFLAIGNWEWTNNPQGSISDESQNVIGESELFLDGIKVANAAQTSIGLGFDFTIVNNLTFDWQTIWYDNLYAAFDPQDRDDRALVGIQPLELPAYMLTDIGLTWRFKFLGQNAYLRGNVNNLFDEQYVSWASDNVEEEDKTINDDKDSAEYQARLDGTRGWWGFGRTWNLAFKFYF